MTHIRSSDVSMEGFIKRVHIYLSKDSYVGRDSYKELTCIYVGIGKRTSHSSMERFICRE